MSDTPMCQRCNRPILYPVTEHEGPCDTGITAYLVHQGYGCDTGCCGHQAYLLDARGEIVASYFAFMHPFDDQREDFIRNTIHNHWPWATINYAKCDVLDD